MSEPNFADFDAPDPGDDLSGFDAASVETAVPPGDYL